MSVYRQTQRLPYPVWPQPQDWRPLLVAALLVAIIATAAIATIGTGIVTVMLIRNAVAPAPIAAPVVAAPAPQPKVATAVQPVTAPSPLRVEWKQLELPGGDGTLVKIIGDKFYIAGGLEGSIDLDALWQSENGDDWTLLVERPETKFREALNGHRTVGAVKSAGGVTAKFIRGNDLINWNLAVSVDGKTWEVFPLPWKNFVPFDDMWVVYESSGTAKIILAGWQATIAKSPSP
jgi:hypothetical protein